MTLYCWKIYPIFCSDSLLKIGMISRFQDFSCWRFSTRFSRFCPRFSRFLNIFKIFLLKIFLKYFKILPRFSRFQTYFEDLTAKKMVLKRFKIFEFYYLLSLFIVTVHLWILYLFSIFNILVSWRIDPCLLEDSIYRTLCTCRKTHILEGVSKKHSPELSPISLVFTLPFLHCNSTYFLLPLSLI